MIIFLLAILFLLTRLYNLTQLPIFNDEANYIYWAKNIAETNAQWFFILTDGKPPLPHWAMVFFLKLLPGQFFLLAGRLPSVLAGLLGALGLYFLTLELFNKKKAALICVLLYILCPFVLFNDRMALFDPYLNCSLVWTVFFFFKASKSSKRFDFLLWSTLQGIALLSKPTAIIYWALLPVCYLILNFEKLIADWKSILKRAIAVMIISEIIHNALIAISKGYLFYITRPFGYVGVSKVVGVEARLQLFIENLTNSINWLTSYYTWPIFIIGIISFIFLIAKKSKIGVILGFLWLGPILILSLFGAFYFSRYILFTTPYFFIPLGYSIFLLTKKSSWKVSLALISLLLFLPVRFNFQLLSNFEKAPLPEIDKWQYFTGYPSSSGFEPIYNEIDKKLMKSSVLLLVQGGLSHFPNAFKLRYYENSRIEIIDSQDIEELIAKHNNPMEKKTILIVLRDNIVGGKRIEQLNFSQLQIITIGKKPGGEDKVYLAKLK